MWISRQQVKGLPSSFAAQSLSGILLQQAHQHLLDLLRHSGRIVHLLEEGGKERRRGEGGEGRGREGGGKEGGRGGGEGGGGEGGGRDRGRVEKRGEREEGRESGGGGKWRRRRTKGNGSLDGKLDL